MGVHYIANSWVYIMLQTFFQNNLKKTKHATLLWKSHAYVIQVVVLFYKTSM